MSNATAPDLPVPNEILLLVGPILVGGLLSYCLFGISIVQLYIYHLSFPNDPKIIQASVYTIFVLDIFQSIAVAVMGWHTLCSGWGRPSALTFPGWTFSAVPCVSGIIAAWVQIFYAWRIRSLGRWVVVPCCIVVVALAQACGALAVGIGFVPLKDVARLHDVNMYARTIVWLGGAALTDVVISISMLYLLYSAKRNALGRTERILNRLIRLTVETGIVTSASATLELAFFLGFSENNLHAVLALILCKVYSNALMTSLNSRRGGPVTGTNQTSWNTITTPEWTSERTTAPTAIHISTNTEVSEDQFFRGKPPPLVRYLKEVIERWGVSLLGMIRRQKHILKDKWWCPSKEVQVPVTCQLVLLYECLHVASWLSMT